LGYSSVLSSSLYLKITLNLGLDITGAIPEKPVTKKTKKTGIFKQLLIRLI